MIGNVVFGHISHRSALKGFLRIPIMSRAEDQNGQMAIVLLQPAEQVIAALSRKVYEDGIRTAAVGLLDRVHRAARFTDNVDIRSATKDLSQPMADNRIVRHDEKTNDRG